MINLRKMEQQDVPFIGAIERSVSADPWSDKLFSDCIRVGYKCWVIEVNGDIVGFGILNHAAEEAHILSLTIAPDWQRKGLGRKMLEKLISTALELGVNILYLEVKASNQAAIALYKNFDFLEIGVRKKYYRTTNGDREDAITFALDLKK